ncbi:hypothetical protein ACFVIM_05635 [Streptomyces sp. NPDC057638]|uniref:hypothetical protein n=1 Tax=Streptomyces sp. NPDC057638 TaxID=3346190 RepID=UPI0036C49829
MSDTTGTAPAHEAYAFACMRCGYGWEQSYDIEHHIDPSGHEYVVYRTGGGVRVPSPLSSPTCGNCGNHVVRIMRSGQVSAALGLVSRTATTPEQLIEELPVPPAGPIGAAGIPDAQPRPPRREHVRRERQRREHHHWHLSDLLHPFHRR